MKPIVNVSETRNGRTVSIVDSQVLIDGNPVKGLLSPVSEVLTKPLIVSLYGAATNQVRALTGDHLKNLSFDSLVSESTRLLEIRDTLQRVRCLNAEGSRVCYRAKTLPEKTEEELHAVFGRFFTAIRYGDDAPTLTKPQHAALEIVTRDYIGGNINDWDFNDIYNPVSDDDSASTALVKEFNAFPFEKYIPQSAADRIRAEVSKIHATHCERVAAFRRFRDVAGADLVNWGSHKFHSQAKKHNLTYHYIIGRWAETLSKELLKSGAPVAEKKQTSVQKLKAKYEAQEELTQSEYISLFKAEGESSAYRVILNHMTADTAASLLECETKNVSSKLISTYRDRARPLDGLKAIVSVLSRAPAPAAFEKLKTYFEKKRVSHVTWDLLACHVGQYSVDEFLAWVESDRRGLPETEFDATFFNQVLAALPQENQLKTHPAITHAFLARMADQQKLDFLDSYRKVPLVLARFGQHDAEFSKVSWTFSADLFFDLPYQALKEFFTNAEGMLLREFTCFIPTVMKADDGDVALQAFICGHADDTSELVSVLSFDQKVQVLIERAGRSSYDVNKMFPDATDRKRFARIALEHSELSHYLEDLPAADLDSNVKAVMGIVYVPLTREILKALSKASIMKILASGGFKSRRYSMLNDIDLKRELYARISRKDFDKVLGGGPVLHPDRIALVGLMTEEEICAACYDRDFLRINLTNVPDSYLERFRDKEEFKKIVGDRRNGINDSFGRAIEKRLGI